MGLDIVLLFFQSEEVSSMEATYNWDSNGKTQRFPETTTGMMRSFLVVLFELLECFYRI